MTTIVKSLPKASHSRGPSPSHWGQGSVDVPLEVHHHQELYVHDDRTQTAAIGVDPVEYGRMVGEAQRLLEESKSRGFVKRNLLSSLPTSSTTYDYCPTTSPVMH